MDHLSRNIIRQMYMLRICIILAILSISIEGKCKEKVRTIELWGHVKDAFTRSAIRDVYITLMTEDSIFIDSMHVNYYNEGSVNLDAYYKFDIPATPAVYIIKAEHPNYYSQSIRFEIKKGWHIIKEQINYVAPSFC